MNINDNNLFKENMQPHKRITMDWGYEEHFFPNSKYPFFVKKKYKQPASKWIPHWHENPEIILIDKGNANISIDGELFYAKEGDVIVINSGCMHPLYPIESTVEYTVIIVSLNILYDVDINPKIQCLSKVINDSNVNFYIMQILSDYNSEEPYALGKTKTDIVSLFIYLFRYHEIKENSSHKKRVPSARTIAQTTMEYIYHHYAEDISTAELAKKLSISVNYLCRCFNQITGFTVSDHLNYVRCTAAKSMLSNMDSRVGEVATAVGFNNLSYFARQYKKHFGHAPSETKKK